MPIPNDTILYELDGKCPETFIWTDGQRPSLGRSGSVTEWVDLIESLRIDFAVIFLNDTDDHGETWNDRDLLAASQALRDKGLGVVWMFWAFTKPEAVRQQVGDLDRLYAHFIPDGVMWDAEEGWDKSQAPQSISILGDGLDNLNAKHGCNPEYSVTAISIYGKRIFTDRVVQLLAMPQITVGYGQSYLFWNGKTNKRTGKPHWSQSLPRVPGALQSGVTEAWMRRLAVFDLEGYFVGNAAHFQNWPDHMQPDMAFPGPMEWGIQATYDLRDEYGDDAVRGCGWWSLKHVRRSLPKIAVLQNAKRPYHQILRIQELLNREGYDVGEPTGVMVPATRLKIRHYLMDMGFAPDDVHNPELLDLIRTHTRIKPIP